MINTPNKFLTTDEADSRMQDFMKGSRFKNFTINICKANPTWSLDDYIEKTISEIKEIVKDSFFKAIFEIKIKSLSLLTIGLK